MTAREQLQTERDETVIRLLKTTISSRAELIAEYERRSVEAFAPSTRRNYVQIIKMFRDWCSAKSFESEPPIHPSVIAAYVDDMGGKICLSQCRSATAASRCIFEQFSATIRASTASGHLLHDR